MTKHTGKEMKRKFNFIKPLKLPGVPKISEVKVFSMITFFAAAYLFGAALHGVKNRFFQEEVTVETASDGNWGLGFPTEGEPSVGNASCEELAAYHAAYRDPDEEQVIYLTFDAGYENGNTEPILDALKKHNAPATFFVVGTYIESNPELIKRMIAEGHIVGNHTYHHPDMSQIADTESFRAELQAVEQQYEALTGEKMTPFYRPPQGKYSESNLKMANEMGYYTFFWSLAYVDWIQDQQPTKEEAYSKLLTRIHPGAIVLLHSTSSTNAEILDELLTKWEEMGYRFAPLTDITEKMGV